MKTLIIHIGTAKTGTTSIQEGLAKNALRLERSGFFYPSRKGAAYLQNSQHVPLVSGICGHPIWWLDPQKQANVDRTLPELRADIEASAAQTVVLSSEAFTETQLISAEKVEAVRDTFSDFDIRIVAYIRRQDHYILSQYQQNVRAGDTQLLRPEKFRNFEGLFYRRRLEPWRDTFGAAKMTVRPFDSRFWRQDDPFLDFLDVIGAPQEGIKPPPATNEGLDYRIVELTRRLNSLLRNRTDLTRQQQLHVRRHLLQLIGKQNHLLPDRRKMRLSPEQANAIRLALHEDNAWSLEGSGVDVDDFFPEVSEGPPAQIRPDSLDPNLLLSVITALALTLADMPAALLPQPGKS